MIAYSFETGADLYFVNTTAAAAAGAPGIRVSPNAGGFAYLKPGDTLRVGVGGPNPETRTVASVIRNNTIPNVLFTQPLANAHPNGSRVEGAALQTGVGFQPDYATEGKHEALEFSAGNYGLLESAFAYAKDRRAPQVRMTGERRSSAADRHHVRLRRGAGGDPLHDGRVDADRVLHRRGTRPARASRARCST